MQKLFYEVTVSRFQEPPERTGPAVNSHIFSCHTCIQNKTGLLKGTFVCCRIFFPCYRIPQETTWACFSAALGSKKHFSAQEAIQLTPSTNSQHYRVISCKGWKKLQQQTSICKNSCCRQFRTTWTFALITHWQLLLVIQKDPEESHLSVSAH